MIPLYDNVPTRRFPVVTVALIVANLIVFAFELSLPRYGITPSGFFYRLGAIPYELVHQLDVPPRDIVPWELTPFTSMFLHAGWLHIIFNMLFLWIFGNNVEDAMGRLRFLVFYLACGLVAVVAQTAIHPGSLAPTVGASGAIAGVLGAYILLYPRASVLSFVFFFVVPLPAWLWLGVWFATQVVQGAASLGQTGGVAYLAHIGGFVAGLCLVFVFARGRMKELRRGRRPPPSGWGYSGGGWSGGGWA
jgi:membrane associated rhomboid family serine protease